MKRQHQLLLSVLFLYQDYTSFINRYGLAKLFYFLDLFDFFLLRLYILDGTIRIWSLDLRYHWLYLHSMTSLCLFLLQLCEVMPAVLIKIQYKQCHLYLKLFKLFPSNFKPLMFSMLCYLLFFMWVVGCHFIDDYIMFTMVWTHYIHCSKIIAFLEFCSNTMLR